MTAPLSPVDALQDKIDGVRSDINVALAHDHVPWPDEYLLLAALEYVRASENLAAAHDRPNMTADAWKLLDDVYEAARVKFYEELER